MNWTLWFGMVLLVVAMVYSFASGGGTNSLFNVHGVIIVIGGTFVATLVNCPLRNILSAAASVLSLFLPSRLPRPRDIVAEMARLARRAQTEGGLLSLQNESPRFADGFLRRAVNVAVSSGESNEIRRILETEIRQLRIRRQEDSNLVRTIGTLSPMFGLLGTLLGMVQVLEALSVPTRVGPAMAMALSSAFIGIAFANLFCLPVAGQMRLHAMSETMALEMILEGVLDIASGKPPALVELHLQGYADRGLDRPVSSAG
jgi:chemotaxis protein MotA